MPGVRVRAVPAIQGQNRMASMTFTHTATIAGSSPARAPIPLDGCRYPTMRRESDRHRISRPGENGAGRPASDHWLHRSRSPCPPLQPRHRHPAHSRLRSDTDISVSVRGDDLDGWTALQHICSRASGMDARVGADQRREHLDLGHDATDVSTDATCSEIRVRADPTAIRLLTIQPGSHSTCFSSTIDRAGSTSSQTHPTTSQAHEYQQLPRGWNEGATAFTGPEQTITCLMMSTAKSICSLHTEMSAAIVIPGETPPCQRHPHSRSSRPGTPWPCCRGPRRSTGYSGALHPTPPTRAPRAGYLHVPPLT